MKSLLMSTALAALLLLPGGGANAAIIANLGINPNSSKVTSPTLSVVVPSKTSSRSNWSAVRRFSPSDR